MKSSSNSNIPAVLWLSAFSIIEALQLLMIVVLFANAFLGIDVKSAESNFFDYFKHSVHPERELTYFRIFVFLALGIQTVGLWLFRQKWDQANTVLAFRRLTVLGAGWLLVQLFALFKIVLFDNPLWARILLYMALAGAVFSNIFFHELRRYVLPRIKMILSQEIKTPWVWMIDAGVLIFIALAILIPDADKAIARLFVFNQWLGFDHYVMGPVWASSQGLTLGVDVLSPLGNFLPSLIAKLTRGVSYPSVLNVLVALTLIYYAVLYGFLRLWLKNVLIACAAVMLAIKLEFFNISASPLIWQHPQWMPLRHSLDVVVLGLLWMHSQSRWEKWLWCAVIAAGLGIVYMLDTGLYLAGAVWVYMVVWFWWEGQWGFARVRKLAALAIAPLAVAGIVFLMTYGHLLFTAVFLHNIKMFFDGWMHGLGQLPIYYGLKDHQFFALFMGLMIPVFYCATMMIVIFRRKFKTEGAHDRWIMAVCAYGLLGHQNFIGRPEASTYYVFAVPLVFIMCFWFQEISAVFSERLKNTAIILLSILSIAALMTNYLFTYYPNVFNVAGYDWSTEKKILAQQFPLEPDVALIRKFTNERDRVVLLSSFEVKILMEARRKPFFPYFPLVQSNLFSANEWRGLHLLTKAQLLDVVDRLEKADLPYVFVEKKLWLKTPEENQRNPSLLFILNYLQQHYEAGEEGQYLLALKKKK